MINNNFERFGEKTTYDVVGKLIKKVEEEFHIKAMFGRIAGSKTQGLSSKASDNDFLIFCKKQEGFSQEKHYGVVYYPAELLGEMVEFEIGWILVDNAVQDVMERYNKNYINYPTNFYRTPEEEKEYLPENMPKLMIDRKEYAFVMFHLLILGDTIWASEELSEFDFNQLYRMEKTIDVLDTYFVRAYGNYRHFFNNKDVVLARKYLYTFSQLFAMEWLLKYRTKPPVNFKELEEEMLGDLEVKKILDTYYELNKNTELHKTKYQEKSSEILNKYIGESLEKIKGEMERYSRTETYEEIILRTEPSKRPQIYDEKYHTWRSLK